MSQFFPPNGDTCTGCRHLTVKLGEYPNGGPYCNAYRQIVEAEIVLPKDNEPARLFICLREDRVAREAMRAFKGAQYKP